jgi:membrane protein
VANTKKRSPLTDLMGGVVALLAIGAALFKRRGPERVIDLRDDADAAPQPQPRDEGRRPTGIKGKVYAVAGKHRPLCVMLKMNDRYGEVNGNFLAGAITLQSFLSLFPLLLLVLSVAGFIAANHNPDLAVEIIAKLGLSGQAAQAFSTALQRAVDTRGTALGVATVGLLWSGLALVGSFQFAYDQVWQVEQRGIKDKLVGVAWLVGAAVLFLASAAVTTVLGLLPGFLWPVGIALTLATNVALWLWTSKLLPNRDVGWRPLVPGAIVGGVGLEILKFVGRFWVPHLVASSSAVYGSIGVVFAILAWLFFFGRLIVYSACLNVVLYEEKAGTLRATIEVPNTPEVSAEVRRSGQTEPVPA